MKKLLLFSLFALLASAMGWAATETWVKVTSTPASWDGDYLIVYENGNSSEALNVTGISDQTKKTVTQDSKKNITISDNTIITEDCDFFVTIKETTTSGQYSITSKSGYQIGIGLKSTDKNQLYTGALTNTLSLNKNNEIQIRSVQNTNMYLRRNSNNSYFRYYTSAQKPIALYKKQEGSATKVAPLEIKPGFGTIEVGTEITISCATGGAVLNGTIGTATLKGAALPYTFTASEVGEIEVGVWATNTKDGYEDSEPLSGTFIVKAAVPVAYRDVITEAVIEKKNSYQYVDYNTAEPIGALYNICALAKNEYLQFNDNKATDKNKAYTGIVMKTSQAAASKLIITWNSNTGTDKSFEVYGKNTPYTSTKDLYGDNPGNLIETVAYSSEGPTTVDLGGKYTYIAVKPKGGVSFVTSFEFIWNEGAAGGADVTYTKASEAKAGNFAVLATADGKAIGRNADLSPVNVTVSVSGDAIGLAKGQTAIDEFEIKENGNNYQLYGGLASNGSRRYLTYNATGVTTVATADDNADVTFVSTEAGLLVKFKDGQYLMFNGTNFIKADNGGTLTPVIVFMSSSNVSTGVETVEFDENAEAQYFNLNGVQVKAENLTPGLYIVRQGNKVSKQVIR